jgi:hypothetical protein
LEIDYYDYFLIPEYFITNKKMLKSLTTVIRSPSLARACFGTKVWSAKEKAEEQIYFNKMEAMNMAKLLEKMSA